MSAAVTNEFPADMALASRRLSASLPGVPAGERPKPSEAALFLTTRWSVVIAAGKERSAESDGALSWLCEKYWYPLYAYARQRGNQPAVSEDLVQGFFERLMDRNVFQDLQAEAGRFRAFMLTCFHRHMTDEWLRTQRTKRGGGVNFVPIEEAVAEARYQRDLTDNTTPEREFDRAWAKTLLERVLARLATECEAEGKGGRFRVIQPFLQNEMEGRSYDSAAAELHISPSALRVIVFRMRQRFRDMVVEEIRQTVADEADIAAELRYLFTALGSGS